MKEHGHHDVPITQRNVDEAGKPHQMLPPQSDQLRAGQALLGRSVRALIDGRMQTIYLTEFDGSNGTYWGVAMRTNPAEDAAVSSATGAPNFPKFTPVSGLRPYPYAERPGYSFQFVRPGDDEAVLINIAATNMPQARETAVEEVQE